jgi:hypothetical protein
VEVSRDLLAVPVAVAGSPSAVRTLCDVGHADLDPISVLPDTTAWRRCQAKDQQSFVANDSPSASRVHAWRRAGDCLRMSKLVEQYGDLPLGTTDAAVIALAERLDIAEIATLDLFAGRAASRRRADRPLRPAVGAPALPSVSDALRAAQDARDRRLRHRQQ